MVLPRKSPPLILFSSVFGLHSREKHLVLSLVESWRRVLYSSGFSWWFSQLLHSQNFAEYLWAWALSLHYLSSETTEKTLDRKMLDPFTYCTAFVMDLLSNKNSCYATVGCGIRGEEKYNKRNDMGGKSKNVILAVRKFRPQSHSFNFSCL